MPIALLPELTRILLRTGRVLSPWSRLAELEEQVLRRARGAFLVHWFGTSVPVQGLHLHVAIRNIEELRRRYLLVERSMPGPATELNLLGPLAGIGGLVVGMAMSPVGWILVARYVGDIADRLVGGTSGGIIAMIYRLAGFLLAPLLVIGLGLPAALVGALAVAVGGGPTGRAAYELLGELAMLIDSAVRFWDLVTGPRSAVRNPVLLRILNVLDRFAGLFAQVIGVAALLLTRVARLVPHIVNEFRALGDLLEVVVAALADVLGGIGDRLAAAFVQPPDPLTILERVFDTFVALPGAIVAEVTALLTNATAALTAGFAAISAAITTFVDGLRARLVAAFEQTPVGVLLARVNRLRAMMPAVGAAFTAAANRPPPEPGLIPIDPIGDIGGAIWDGTKWVFSGGLTGSINDLIESFDRVHVPPFPAVTVPPFPSPPAIEGIDAIMTRLGRPAAFDATALAERMQAEADAALAGRRVPAEVLRDPTSQFARERRALEASHPAPTLQFDDERLRDLIYLAVGRVLPPALRTYAPDVRALFDEIDRGVYDAHPAALEHPMLELEDNGRLRPVVHLLTVRAHDGAAPDVGAFRDLLVEELRGRPYLVRQAD